MTFIVFTMYKLYSPIFFFVQRRTVLDVCVTGSFFVTTVVLSSLFCCSTVTRNVSSDHYCFSRSEDFPGKVQVTQSYHTHVLNGSHLSVPSDPLLIYFCSLTLYYTSI